MAIIRKRGKIMKYAEFKYERAEIKEIQKNFKDLIRQFDDADSFHEQCSIIGKINEIRDEFTSMQVLSELKKCLGEDKELYGKEIDYYNEAEPILDGLVSDYYKVLYNSKFKAELEEKFGEQLFKLAEMKEKCVADNIIVDLQQEKKLVTEYVDLFDSVRREFEGEELGIWDFWEHINSNDRNMRKHAYENETELYKEHEEKMHDLFDRFVKTRHEMALKMGYENFVEMGYARMNRIGYDRDMIAKFRKQVQDYIVPLNNELTKRQAKRLGVEKIKYYDEPVHFLSGNAEIKGGPNEMIDKALKMYSELSDDTSEFFKHMVQNNLFDVEKRDGKEEGGFCTYIPKYKAPFIYAVCRGNVDDLGVFTHEAGHAFQFYLCKDYDIPEYCVPPEDICEIHSMSMEFLAEPWLEEFFGDDADKYKFSQMSNSLSRLAYIVAIDEFQHFVYEKPSATYEERNSHWRELEKKYLPHRDYEDNDFLEKGSYWLRQSHVFWGPFYYIDYGLARVVAFNFWYKAKKDRAKAWEDYMNVCRAGGSKPLLEVIELGNLKSPFEDGSIEEITKTIKEWVLEIEERLESRK